MKRDPTDPDGEYERESRYFCAEEVYIPQKDIPFLPPKKKTVTEHCHELLVQREIIGRGVHHRPLFHDVRSALEWMEEALEEEADKLQYLMAAFLCLKEIFQREKDAP